MLGSQEPAAWWFKCNDYESVTLLREHADAMAASYGTTPVPLYCKPMLEKDEREALGGLACYLDMRGNIQLQAWGSLLRILLARFS
jgi:hypothetical protein